MKFIYDGPSLPMLKVGKGIFRVQVLAGGAWESLSEEECAAFLAAAVSEYGDGVSLDEAYLWPDGWAKHLAGECEKGCTFCGGAA